MNVWSPNKKPPTAEERLHIERIKSMPCVLCEAPGPSDAHHIRQRSHFYTVPLCRACHDSWHGTKDLWRIKKWDELDAFAATMERISHA